MSDPEETAPFTHRPYGKDKDGDENPFVSPSGPAAQASGPAYVQPPVPPPPTSGPPSYGPPPPGYPQPWQAPWAPAYGAPYPGSQDHKGATTSLVLGIISIVSLVGAVLCCITIPGVLCAPFAWVIGAKAVREMDRSPGVYGNRSSAVAGMWMGVVMTILGFLAIAGFVALVAWIGIANPSLV